MRTAGKGALLALILLLASCGDEAADRLSHDEAAAYAVLAEELHRRIGSDPQELSFGLCVRVSLPDGGKVRDMVGLMDMLQRDMPSGVDATLVPVEDCKRFSDFGPYRVPSGARATLFFASAESNHDGADSALPAGEQLWSAGINCGPLCGNGRTYRVRFEGGHPVLTLAGEWVN
jgi:hypothetical protein